MARGATYSRSSGPVSLRLQLVATGVNRPDPFSPLLPLRTSSGLRVPPCVSRWASAPVLVLVLDTPSIPTQLGLFYLVSGAIVIHLTHILYPVSSICSPTCFFVPVLASASPISAPVSVLSSAVATGCSSEDSGCYPKDPGRSPEGSVSSPKVSPMNSVART